MMELVHRRKVSVIGDIEGEGYRGLQNTSFARTVLRLVG